MAKNTEATVSYLAGKKCYLDNRYYNQGDVVEVVVGSELHDRIEASKPKWLVKMAPGQRVPTEREVEDAKDAAEQAARDAARKVEAEARKQAGQADQNPKSTKAPAK